MLFRFRRAATLPATGKPSRASRVGRGGCEARLENQGVGAFLGVGGGSVERSGASGGVVALIHRASGNGWATAGLARRPPAPAGTSRMGSASPGARPCVARIARGQGW